MNQIGRTIFFDIETGDIIVDTGEKNTTAPYRDPDFYITRYKSLTERNRETFDYIELAYGQYAQDFQEGTLVGVNLDTLTPIFEYPNPENPDEPVIVDKPLSEQIEQLKVEQAKANSELVTLIMAMNGGIT